MTISRTSLVAAAAAAAITVSIAPVSADARSMPISAPASVRAVVAPVRPYVLRVGLSGTTVLMPSRLHAGTYFVHVSTTDQVNELQVVRPPRRLSRTRFVSLWRAWWNRGDTGPGNTWKAWRTSATFVGGAQVVNRSLPYLNRTPGGVGTFAITLRPGTYWFYTGENGDLQTLTGRRLVAVRPSRIRVVSVYATAPTQTHVPLVGTVRFGSYRVAGKLTSVFLPTSLPAHGYLRGVGTPGYISTLNLRKLRPGVTQARLVPGDCYPDSGGAWGGALDCFEPYRYRLGGGVSAGSAAVWWYTIPTGSYAVSQGSHSSVWDTDRPSLLGQVTIVSFS